MTAKTLQAVPEPSSPTPVSSRCLQKGTLSVGLLSVPVGLHSATGEQGAALHQIHRADGGRIRQKKVCEDCGAELAAADIGKGYELAGHGMIALTDAEAEAGRSDTREIEVLSFCPAAQVDPLMLGKAYYLAPGDAGAKGYALLAAALAKSGKAAIARLSLRKVESMAVITSRAGLLMLQLLAWADEVRLAPALPETGLLRPAEMKAAAALITSMSGEWNPAAYHSGSRAALDAVIEAKLAGPSAAASGKAPKKVPGLAETLRASLAQSKAEREGAQAS